MPYDQKLALRLESKTSKHKGLHGQKMFGGINAWTRQAVDFVSTLPRK